MTNLIIADQRLALLQALVACNNDANQNILQTCLAQYGHNISMDLVRNHMLWLEEQGLQVPVNCLWLLSTSAAWMWTMAYLSSMVSKSLIHSIKRIRNSND